MTLRVLAVACMLAALALIGCVQPWTVVSQATPSPLVGERRFTVAPVDFSEVKIGTKSEGVYFADKKDKEKAEEFKKDKVAMGEAFTKSLLSSAKEGGIELQVLPPPPAPPEPKSPEPAAAPPAPSAPPSAPGDAAPATPPAAAPAAPPAPAEPAVAAPAPAPGFVIKPTVILVELGFFAVIASGPSRVVLRLKIEDASGKLIDEIEIAHRTNPTTWEKITSGVRLKEDAEAIGRIAGEYLRERVAPR